MKKFFLRYLLPGAAIIALDQATKWLALNFWQETNELTSFLAFELTVNRGISWGLLQGAESQRLFIGISFLIGLLTCGLIIYALKRYRKGYPIYGELFNIAGSISNLIDRALHQGVIDFIVVHWGDYVWPIFNVADIFIVLGVGLMFVQQIFLAEPPHDAAA